MITTRDSRSSETRGFVLLYAVMTASIVLAVGVSIISIAMKQLSIANLGRESQYAFYAANTGAECALYLDFHGVLGTTGTVGTYRRLAVFLNPFMGAPEITEAGDIAQVECARTPLMGNPYSAANPNYEWVVGECADPSGSMGYSTSNCDSTAFTVFLGRREDGTIDPDGACARVTVEKVRGNGSDASFNPSATGENLQTTVDSRGYNYCSDTNSRRVERGLRFTY